MATLQRNSMADYWADRKTIFEKESNVIIFYGILKLQIGQLLPVASMSARGAEVWAATVL